jgi:DNA-binding NarL/FixJ family response regulator
MGAVTHMKSRASGGAAAPRPSKASLSEDPVLRNTVMEQAALLAPLERSTAQTFGRELVHGEWKLIQRFDRDGRRFFVWERDAAPKSAGRALTDRERVVLSRVARGLGDRAVSAELGCSTSTVATHRLRAMAKLGIGSRTLLAQVLSGVSLADD